MGGHHSIVSYPVAFGTVMNIILNWDEYHSMPKQIKKRAFPDMTGQALLGFGGQMVTRRARAPRAHRR